MAMRIGKICNLVVLFVFLSFTAEVEGNSNPDFDQILEYYALPEEEKGYFVGTLIATDADGDTLTYGIRDTAIQYLGNNPYSNAKLYLVVDPLSGEVTVQTPVDRETATNLRPTWTVTDGIQEIAIVGYLTVTDKNDVIPRFQGLQDRLDPVLENTAIGESITSFAVIDEDYRDNGLVDVTNVTDDTDCDEFHPFDIHATKDGEIFEILVKDDLDYSEQSQYILCLVAEDRAGGTDSLKSNISKILIPIRDVQDKPPVFLQLPYNEEIYENNEVGSVVTQVTAQDGDRGVPEPNSIEFTLSSPYFEIDSHGVITTKISLDRESLDENPFRLIVIATEDDDSQLIEQKQSNVSVVITVLDEDDEAPKFSDKSVAVELFENSQEGTPLNLGVTVTDADERKNAAFDLEIKQPFDVFELATDSGLGSALVGVTVKNSSFIDYETRQQINFTIIASSSVGNDSLEVTVDIVNLNDNDPIFKEVDGYQEEFAEDVSKGYSILTVHATDEDIGAVVTYEINPPVNEFEVGESSGEITTALDAKSYSALLRPEYVFTVEASDGEIVRQTLVTLTCTDVNDEVPVFQRHFEEIFQTEFHDDIPDEAVITLRAFDADPTEPNNQLSYNITGGDPDGKFWINETSGELYFVDYVDYDDGDHAYHLTISAIDHGSPPQEGSTTLNVTILDKNDNAPEFDEEVYMFNVREDVSRESDNDATSVLEMEVEITKVNISHTVFGVVGTVSASDKDSGNNQKIVYDIISGGSGLFYIPASDDNVARISVGGALDKETAPEDGYILSISAQDRGSPPLSTSCLVNITVTDVNDEKPVFDPGQGLEYSVPEDETSGYLILTLHATDPDGNSKLSYHIENIIAKDELGNEVVGDFTNQFSCDENDGTISVNENLDRELVETFSLEVMVNDTNAETGVPQTDSVTVTIAVMDINDNAPVFENITEGWTVREHSANGTIVSTEIHANDADTGSNGEVVYSLEDDASGAFRIDRGAGNIRVHNSALIDREMYAMLTIKIRATDGGSPPKYAEKEVDIIIEDVNDHTPEFENHAYSAAVREHSAIDTFVCEVTAVDEDAEFGVLSYTIAGGNTREWFKIDSTTGNISVANDSIDRDAENINKVTLVVVAVDPGQRRDTTEVIVQIEDINDNPPVFIYIEDVTIPEDIAVGAVISTVVATDLDKEDTAASAVEYNITGGNGTDYFAIGSETGQITTTEDLNNDTIANVSRVYEITIQAKDKAEPFNSAMETMFIIVDDAGNTAPVITFPKAGSVLNMTEHYNDPEKPLYVAKATDIDAGDDSKVAFRLAENSGTDWEKFRVDNYTGELFYIAEPPDWYYNPQFSLTLEAYNYLSVSEDFDSVDFIIEVIDVDNYIPVFESPVENETATTEMQVQEKVEGGTVVGSVSALDRDDDNPIYYFIIDGNDEGYFEINKSTGEISTTEELDGSSISSMSYELTIKATGDETYGEGEATRKKRQTSSNETIYDPTIIMVTVNIVDLNDNPPYFPEELYTAGVLYTTEFDVIVTTVSAEDDDPDEFNRNMTYSILSQNRLNLDKEVLKENDTSFYIDPKTGDLYTMASFLRLTGGVYFQLRIEVVDPYKERVDKFFNQTDLLIYVIIENQQLNIHTNVSADETKVFEMDLSEKLNVIMSEFAGGSYDTDFDRISSHIDSSGNVNSLQADALFHVVNLTDNVNEIVPAPDVLYILDHSPTHVDDVREEFSVNSINLAAYTPEEPTFTSFQIAVIVVAGIFLVFLILAVIAFCFYQNQNQRILDAYGIVIENDYYVSKDEPLTKTADPVHENPGFVDDVDGAYEGIEFEGSEASTVEKVMTIDDDEEEPPADENTRNKFLANLLHNQQKLEGVSDMHISDV